MSKTLCVESGVPSIDPVINFCEIFRNVDNARKVLQVIIVERYYFAVCSDLRPAAVKPTVHTVSVLVIESCQLFGRHANSSECFPEVSLTGAQGLILHAYAKMCNEQTL